MVHRISLSGLLLLIAAAAVSPLAAQTRQLQVVQEKAPMFKEHSISSPIIKYLEKGSRLNLLAAEDSFYLVSYGGFEGWVIPFSVRELAAEGGAAPTAESESPQTAPAEEQPAGDGLDGRYVTVKGRYANLREGPGMGYDIVGKAFRGQKLEKFIKRGNWYRVRLPDSKIGFIREDLLSPLGGAKAGSGPKAGTAAAAEQSHAPAPSGTLQERVTRLEQELTELRALLLEHLRGSGGLAASPAAPLDGASAGQADQSTLQGQAAGTAQQTRSGRIIGNRATKVYHLPSSVFYDKIPEEFRVYFNTEEDAQKAGFTKSIR
ncbi:SH3 domain-containing protein [bacterium]|nr:SH3 domain-containing protein [bacterium]